MSTIRANIFRHMLVITLTMSVVIFIAVYLALMANMQSNSRESAEFLATQIEEIIEENRAGLDDELNQYMRNSFDGCTTAALILELDPALMNDTDKLWQLMAITRSAELYVLDRDGKIISSTLPEYCGTRLTDKGEQLAYFTQMLEDTSLELFQPVMESDLTGSLIQYSAVWSGNKQFIVMLGTLPDFIQSSAERTDLTYTFSLLRPSEGIKLCAVDKSTLQVLVSSEASDAEKPISALGIEPKDINDNNLVSGQYVFQATVDGQESYCIFTKLDECIAGYIIPNTMMYDGMGKTLWTIALCLIGISLMLVASVTWYMGKDVISSIHSINEILGRISAGSLKRTVDIKGSLEFAELSQHINDMVSSLLATTDKMSYVLSKTNVRMGVYEYSKNYGETVRYTEYIPELLGLDEKMLARLTVDGRAFEDYIKSLKTNELPDEENVYSVKLSEDAEEVYLKFDDVMWRNDIFGIVVDMTKEIVMRRRIESERDIDPLTSLWNRRGIIRHLRDLFEDPGALGYGVLIMVDTDDLKKINDTYGHEVGDLYLQRVAEMIGKFGLRNNMSARLGGDEFVTFLYGYRTEQELNEDVARFHEMQDSMIVELENDVTVNVRFSAGFSYTYNESNYHILLRTADELMYADKRNRKAARGEAAN